MISFCECLRGWARRELSISSPEFTPIQDDRFGNDISSKIMIRECIENRINQYHIIRRGGSKEQLSLPCKISNIPSDLGYESAECVICLQKFDEVKSILKLRK